METILAHTDSVLRVEGSGWTQKLSSRIFLVRLESVAPNVLYFACVSIIEIWYLQVKVVIVYSRQIFSFKLVQDSLICFVIFMRG